MIFRIKFYDVFVYNVFYSEIHSSGDQMIYLVQCNKVQNSATEQFDSANLGTIGLLQVFSRIYTTLQETHTKIPHTGHSRAYHKPLIRVEKSHLACLNSIDDVILGCYLGAEAHRGL